MENQNWTSTEEVRTGDLTRGPVWRVIVRFAVPLLIGNILQQLYNITDSIIVGQFLGKEALAAVSASFFIYYFIISLVIKLEAVYRSLCRNTSVHASIKWYHGLFLLSLYSCWFPESFYR